MTASSAGESSQPISAAPKSSVKSSSGVNTNLNSSFLVANQAPSSVFQQVKQTQSSLARLSRAHLHISNSQTNQSSQQTGAATSKTGAHNDLSPSGVSSPKSTTFVDCLNRRFKDCFSEDFCTVPMFVVGNLSPGSDGRQNINRFASPKNMRLMNSIRESCKSIEQLDLAGNKLTDLIEVFKILQCTPNLKFLNLSENDLSKSLPVAMASISNSSPVGGSPSFGTSSLSPLTNGHHQGYWSASSGNLNGTRTCLGPITQNQLHQVALANNKLIGLRCHSTLEAQSSKSPASSRAQVSTRASKMTETTARRLASAAVAQSKKTSPLLANKLTSSAGEVKSSKAMSKELSVCGGNCGNSSGPVSKRQATSGSTMQLARSLSSLSAKDVRNSSSSISRLSQMRASCSRHKDWVSSLRRSTTSLSGGEHVGGSKTSCSRIVSKELLSSRRSAVPGSTATKEQKQQLFVETIAETELDVDMSENGGQQQQATGSSLGTTQIIHQHQQQQRDKTGSTGTNMTCKHMATSSTNYRRTFESIKALALNNTGCQWKLVCSILNRMPNLEELHLSLNNYKRIDLDPMEFKHYSLKRLYLCNNPKLTNWQELNKLLLAFPSLEALSIADCNISQIPENLDQAREWRKLCGLNINGWPIKEWPIIERLNQLPSLIDLKCRNLDILNSIDEPRHHLIARLPKLRRLNGSEIEEREHAEKAFLRFFMANSHLERPDRFHELLQIHGEVHPTLEVDVDLSPPSQASIKVVHLNRNYFVKENEDDIMMSEDFLNKLLDHNNLELQNSLDSMEVDSSTKSVRLFKDEGQEVVAIEVDLRQSVRKFKSTLAQLFNLNSQNLILYYIDHEMVGLMGPELIKHNQKKLWNYNVQNGDQFIVEER